LLVKKILVVDDEPNIVRSLAYILKKEGYDVSTAKDGEQAMDMVRDSKPHLMILDVMMPRKSGYDVCEEVKSDPDLRDIHVMMLTAKGQVGDREIGLSKGADEYLTKPFSPRLILNKVKELLG
jgi:DNA-binding response OmpR family regulator